jgi:hypothetical protein
MCYPNCFSHKARKSCINRTAGPPVEVVKDRAKEITNLLKMIGQVQMLPRRLSWWQRWQTVLYTHGAFWQTGCG